MAPQPAQRARALKRELASLANDDSSARAAIEARVEAFNSDWHELDRLIRKQFWRVAFHRVAEDEINYRRFFNINDLAGLRIDVGAVFDHVHARIFRMLESGEIDGLRIDHIDGLFDLKAYLEALRAGARRPFFLVVEKILATDASLRPDWPVEPIAPPDRDDEYMRYQMFVGFWPIDMLDDPSNERKEAYGARIHAALETGPRITSAIGGSVLSGTRSNRSIERAITS